MDIKTSTIKFKSERIREIINSSGEKEIGEIELGKRYIIPSYNKENNPNKLYDIEDTVAGTKLFPNGTIFFAKDNKIYNGIYNGEDLNDLKEGYKNLASREFKTSDYKTAKKISSNVGFQEVDSLENIESLNELTEKQFSSAFNQSMKEGLLGLQATKLPGIDMALEANGFSSTPIVQDDNDKKVKNSLSVIDKMRGEASLKKIIKMSSSQGVYNSITNLVGLAGVICAGSLGRGAGYSWNSDGNLYSNIIGSLGASQVVRKQGFLDDIFSVLGFRNSTESGWELDLEEIADLNNVSFRNFMGNKPGLKIGTKSSRSSNYNEKISKIKEILRERNNHNRIIGMIHVEPFYNEEEFKTFNIPFQFNPEITEGETKAEYKKKEILNKILPLRTYASTASEAYTLTTTYMALAPDSSDPNGTDNLAIAETDPWMFDWTDSQIERIEMQLRSLVMPQVTTSFVRPPIVEIILETNDKIGSRKDFYNINSEFNMDVRHGYESGDLLKYPDYDREKYLRITKALEGYSTRFKRFIVSSVKIEPLNKNSYVGSLTVPSLYSNGYGEKLFKGEEKDNFKNALDNKSFRRKAFNVTLTLIETTKNFVDLVPDYKCYYDAWTNPRQMDDSLYRQARINVKEMTGDNAINTLNGFGTNFWDSVECFYKELNKEENTGKIANYVDYCQQASPFYKLLSDILIDSKWFETLPGENGEKTEEPKQSIEQKPKEDKETGSVDNTQQKPEENTEFDYDFDFTTEGFIKNEKIDLTWDSLKKCMDIILKNAGVKSYIDSKDSIDKAKLETAMKKLSRNEYIDSYISKDTENNEISNLYINKIFTMDNLNKLFPGSDSDDKKKYIKSKTILDELMDEGKKYFYDLLVFVTMYKYINKENRKKNLGKYIENIQESLTNLKEEIKNNYSNDNMLLISDYLYDYIIRNNGWKTKINIFNNITGDGAEYRKQLWIEENKAMLRYFFETNINPSVDEVTAKFSTLVNYDIPVGLYYEEKKDSLNDIELNSLKNIIKSNKFLFSIVFNNEEKSLTNKEEILDKIVKFDFKISNDKKTKMLSILTLKEYLIAIGHSEKSADYVISKFDIIKDYNKLFGNDHINKRVGEKAKVIEDWFMLEYNKVLGTYIQAEECFKLETGSPITVEGKQYTTFEDYFKGILFSKGRYTPKTETTVERAEATFEGYMKSVEIDPTGNEGDGWSSYAKKGAVPEYKHKSAAIYDLGVGMFIGNYDVNIDSVKKGYYKPIVTCYGKYDTKYSVDCTAYSGENGVFEKIPEKAIYVNKYEKGNNEVMLYVDKETDKFGVRKYYVER